MNPREQKILIVTVVLVIGALAFTFLGGEPEGVSSTTAVLGDVKAERQAFKQNLTTLRQGARIREDYAQIDLGVAQSTSRRPEQELSNQLYQLLTERLKVPNPRMATPLFSLIPDVNDYCYVDITVDIQGNYADIINLMQEMNRLGLLIKTFKINQRNRNEADKVDLSITVSRLVKRTELINKKLKAQGVRS